MSIICQVKNSNVKRENIYIIIIFTIEHYQFIDKKNWINKYLNNNYKNWII